MTSRLYLRQVEMKLGAFRLAIDLESSVGCLGVFGPSGAGKTTLLELIAGLRHAQAGQIALDGETVSDVSGRKWIPPHRRRIGYVPQDLALFPHLDVRRNILFGASSSGEEAREPSVSALLEVLELTPLLDRRIHGLSGGERQRVAIARALAAQPRLLLLDEPLTGLDQDRKDNVLDYLRLLRQRWTVPMIYVSHDAGEISELCEEVLVLRDGALTARGQPSDLFEPSARPSLRLRR
jgi:molybdate transport system ATP-binding protein